MRRPGSETTRESRVRPLPALYVTQRRGPWIRGLIFTRSQGRWYSSRGICWRGNCTVGRDTLQMLWKHNIQLGGGEAPGGESPRSGYPLHGYPLNRYPLYGASPPVRARVSAAWVLATWRFRKMRFLEKLRCRISRFFKRISENSGKSFFWIPGTNIKF